MPTNKERRIVAARLRELAKDCASVSDFDLASILELETYGQRSYCVEGVTRLADLIEPEERTCRPNFHNTYYGPCDCGYGVYFDMSYCPYCGAKVVKNDANQ